MHVIYKVIDRFSYVVAMATILFEIGFVFIVLIYPHQYYIHCMLGLFTYVFHYSIWCVMNIDFHLLSNCIFFIFVFNWNHLIESLYCNGYSSSSNTTRSDAGSDAIGHPLLVLWRTSNRDTWWGTCWNVQCFFGVFVIIMFSQTYMGINHFEIGFPFCCYPTFAPWFKRDKRRSRSLKKNWEDEELENNNTERY